MERTSHDGAASGPRLAHLLCLAHVLAFLVLVIGSDASWREPALLHFGLLDAAALVEQPWTLFSYAFLTSDPLEILVAAGVLWLAGVPIEDRLGRRRFLVVYASAVALTGLVHVGLFQAGLVEGRVFVGAVGASAALLTVYLFLFGHERQVGTLPFPIFYLIAAASLFLLMAWVDGQNHDALVAECADLHARAFQDGNTTIEQRGQDLARRRFLQEHQPDQLGHLLGLALGALSLLLVSVAGQAHARYRVRREIRGLQEEVHARARVEQLLEKISREGMDSLSRHERRFLRYASRFYQKAGSP